MSEITKEDLNNLEERQAKRLDRFEGKLDQVVDPKTGIWADLAAINRKADKAHERIDIIEKCKEEKKENRKRWKWVLIGSGVSGIISLTVWILRGLIL